MPFAANAQPQSNPSAFLRPQPARNPPQYRTYGRKVVDILRQSFGPKCVVEKASVDEVYVDVTPRARELLSERGARACVELAAATHVAGTGVGDADEAAVTVTAAEMRAGHAGQCAVTDDELRRAVNQRSFWTAPSDDDDAAYVLCAAACAAVALARKAVSDAFDGRLTCTAGVGPTKMLAKLAAGTHKPNQQTCIAPNAAAVERFLKGVAVEKLRGLGGQLGSLLVPLWPTADALAAAPRKAVADAIRAGNWPHPDDTAERVLGLARGVDDEPVKERTQAVSLSCGKTFRGRPGSAVAALNTFDDVARALAALCSELELRLEERREDTGDVPGVMTVSISDGQRNASRSAAWPLGVGASAARSCDLALTLVRRWSNEVGAREPLNLTALFVSAGDMQPAGAVGKRIDTIFARKSDEAGAAPSAAPAPAPAPAAAAPAAPAATAAPPPPWSCLACTLENAAQALRCEACGTLRGGALPPASTLAINHPSKKRPLEAALLRAGKSKPKRPR